MVERLSIEDAEALVARALIAHGVSPANAASVARALVAAEVDGQQGHGFSRVAAYCGQARSGKVAGQAVPRITEAGPAMLRVDAANGFAYPAIDAALERLDPLARQAGLAGAAITRSHHCGQLGAHVERIAGRGLVGLMVANTPKAMAPWGGNRALFGTNPIAFAAPRAGTAPLVIDLSLSQIARGKVMAAAKRGEAIPEDWAFDSEGKPTTDPQAALSGMMRPAGGAKGAALALMVEVLAATLTGANHSHEASSFFDAEGAPPGVGQFIIAIDPGCTAGGAFAPRIEALIAEMEGQPGVRLPGGRRLDARAAVAAAGRLEIPVHLRAEIEAAAG